MEAGKRNLYDIFNGGKVLEIPYFQRGYVWSEPQWQRLLEDMENISQHKKPYFMGSVILKQQETPSNAKVGDVRTVIDGQQRLTTLHIFFKVLGLRTHDDYLTNELFRLRGKEKELALKHSYSYQAIFEHVMDMQTEEDLSKNKDNISKAYTYFKENIHPEKLDYDAILNNILLVGIDVSKEEDEQQIFDTINSLGVQLTTAELLKNFFFKRDYEAYVKYWQNVFEKDTETKMFWDSSITTGRFKRTIIDLFFYAYLQIKIQETYNGKKVSTEDKIEFSKVDCLFESYKSFIKTYNIDIKTLLDDIKIYAESP